MFHRDLTHKWKLPFAQRCVIQINRWIGSVFWTLVGGLATFKEEPLTPRDALIKAGCAKYWEEV